MIAPHRPLAVALREIARACAASRGDARTSRSPVTDVVAAYVATVALGVRSASDLAAVYGFSQATAKRHMAELRKVYPQAGAAPLGHHAEVSPGLNGEPGRADGGGLRVEPPAQTLSRNGINPEPPALRDQRDPPGPPPGGTVSEGSDPPREARAAAAGWLKRMGAPPSSKEGRAAMHHLTVCWRERTEEWRSPKGKAVSIVRAFLESPTNLVGRLAGAMRPPARNGTGNALPGAPLCRTCRKPSRADPHGDGWCCGTLSCADFARAVR